MVGTRKHLQQFTGFFNLKASLSTSPLCSIKATKLPNQARWFFEASSPSSQSAGFPNKVAIPCPKECRKQKEFGHLIMTPAELVCWMVESHSYIETASSYVTIHVRDCESHNYTILNLISVHHQLNLFLDVSHKLLRHSSPT